MDENDKGSRTTVYSCSFYYRGRRITDECEPPTDLIDDFLDFLADGLVQNEWDETNDAFIEHDYCTEHCAIETCVILGRPYTKSLREAFEA